MAEDEAKLAAATMTTSQARAQKEQEKKNTREQMRLVMQSVLLAPNLAARRCSCAFFESASSMKSDPFMFG